MGLLAGDALAAKRVVVPDDSATRPAEGVGGAEGGRGVPVRPIRPMPPELIKSGGEDPMTPEQIRELVDKMREDMEARRMGAGVGGNALMERPAGRPALMVKRYGGMVLAGADAEARKAADLPEGMGLTVKEVKKGSFAETAGLKTGDLLVKLDDQKLVNAEQLGTLLNAIKSGEAVTFTVIRDGKPVEVKGKVEKAGGMVEVDRGGRAGPVAVPGGMVIMGKPGKGITTSVSTINGETTRTTQLRDDEHELVMTTKGDTKRLVAKDAAGKVIFDDAITTEEERKKLPEGLEDKVKKMEDSEGKAEVRMEVRGGVR